MGASHQPAHEVGFSLGFKGRLLEKLVVYKGGRDGTSRERVSTITTPTENVRATGQEDGGSSIQASLWAVVERGRRVLTIRVVSRGLHAVFWSKPSGV